VTELTIDQALQQGIEAHKAGDLQEADRLYTAILTAQPKHPDANHNMGVLGVSVGKIEQAIPFFKTALETNSATAQYWLSYIDAFIKLERLEDARAVFYQAKSKGAKGDGFDKLEQRLQKAHKELIEASKVSSEPKPEQPNILDNLKLDQAISLAKKKIREGFPEEAKRIYQGVLTKFPKNKRANDGLKRLAGKSVEKASKAQDPPQEQLQALINFYSQGQLQQALTQAEILVQHFPQSDILFNIQGAVLKSLGQLELSVEAYTKALAISPDYADAHNNIGIALKDQGKLEEAIEALNKALAIKPDYAEAYNNMGIVLKDQGKLKEAIEAYNKALAIKPDYAKAHRHLSTVTKYNSDNAQISEVEALLQQTDINDSDRCNFLYAYAKMQEDLGDLSAAFDSYLVGGDLRQKLLGYEFTQDEHLFGLIKRTAPKFKDTALDAAIELIGHTPIFILGMPRSGTTLVEQIISSHSKISGAGELPYVSRFGGQLAVGLTAPTLEAVSVFRERYLAELGKRSDGQAFVTDKMPQNFRYLALICAAFPEAKIIHVRRNAKATCWSNYKHYFASKDLGYSYNLSDTVKYYGLYKNLMHFWYQSYSDRIYNLDYDNLTEGQEPETRRLIGYLGLKWEDACLTPEKNKRSVKTNSQQQVRQKVYKGSSQHWRTYEPMLSATFKDLSELA
jgi:tetratricopeptide (TPR) repeat protein